MSRELSRKQNATAAMEQEIYRGSWGAYAKVFVTAKAAGTVSASADIREIWNRIRRYAEGIEGARQERRGAAHYDTIYACRVIAQLIGCSEAEAYEMWPE